MSAPAWTRRRQRPAARAVLRRAWRQYAMHRIPYGFTKREFLHIAKRGWS